MRDVSNASGVSLASVSRILAGDPSFQVREETRQKVIDAAKELGYAYESNLRTNIKKVGCILNSVAEMYTDQYFATIFSAVDSNLQKSGYSMSSLYTAEDVENLAKQLYMDKLSGLIVFDAKMDLEDMMHLKKSIPHIVGVDTTYRGIDNVAHDDYTTSALAINHLIERGHKRIAYIGGGERSPHGRAFAYNYLMGSNNLPILEDYVLDCGWDPKRCYDLALNLCMRNDRPTAIFAGSDNLAISILSAINEAGLSSPADVAVASINNLDFSAYTTPSLTTVSLPMNEMGAEAANMLLRRINGHDGLPVTVQFHATLIVRSST